MQFIDLKAQYIEYKKSIDNSIHNVLNHGKFIMGPEVDELEEKLADFVQVQHCITVASGTVSLEIALRALNIGPGDQVITVPFTWISTAEVILAVGAKPIFVDIEVDSFNMNPDLLEAAINENTKAIIPVSLFGQMPDMERIIKIANKYELPVIEDAAQSFGATRLGNKSCAASLIGSTSFFPAKVFGCYGDGGALFVDDDELALRMRAIRNHGGIKRGYHDYVGMNGRFDTIQAAILLAKFPHFDFEINARAEIGARYSALLKSVCKTPKISTGNSHVYAQYTIRMANRDSVKQKLQDAGIPSAIYYQKCLHEQPVFASTEAKWGDFPVSEMISREVLSLPMHPFLDEETQDQIVESVIKAIEIE
ncbi:MAG: aminotransferase DegT [Rhodopirellula sp.]|nr:aminotransferase DegT [Rhodopirellula sp.]|tara:strand:+ start:10447 stop:11544 length:1098 start_codon:yes stop_codon:yes gene_type:complete